MIGLGQAEAADPFTGSEFRQELLLLRFGAELVDWHHDERALYAGHRAVARIDALDFACNQPVANVVETGAAVLLGNRGAEQAQGAHFAKDCRISDAGAEAFDHARQQALLAVGVSRIAHHALVVGELLVEQQRVVPMEMRFGGGHGKSPELRGKASVELCASYRREHTRANE